MRAYKSVAAGGGNRAEGRPCSADTRHSAYVVDLDGTLVSTNTLHEQALRLLTRSPLAVPGAIGALFQGKAALKSYLGDRIALDPHSQNYNEELLCYLRERKAEGAYLVLCTAANTHVARSIADHLGIFDEVLATDGGTNLKGPAKAALLRERFPNGFVYAGNSSADLPVWKEADAAILVDTGGGIERRVRNIRKPVLAEFNKLKRSPHTQLRLWVKALRVHHWSKNLLLFVPLVLAHQWFDLSLVAKSVLAFCLLLAVTSSSYLINDLVDIDTDRLHPTKKYRPIANGLLPIQHAALAATFTLPVALGLAFALNFAFGLSLIAYLMITLSYSLALKRIPIFDTFLIAVLFTSRVVMGSTLLVQPLSEWLLTFSMFLFFSLAVAKRHTELTKAGEVSDATIRTRGYQQQDIPLTLVMGTAAGLASIIIMVMYLVEEAFRTVYYERPTFLWAVVLCLAIWIGRIWLLAHRGQMDDDPVSFALQDRISLGLGLLVAAAFVLAL